MASDSKAAGGIVTKEIESRLKQTSEHLFQVFLEIREPINDEAPQILLKYPKDFTSDDLERITEFAYPCKIPSDEQSEHFAFALVDEGGALLRFGFCRRSNRESTCLCIISYYPWFETFFNILNDLSQIINSKATAEMEQFLSILYNHKLMSIEEFHQNEGKEIIEVNTSSKTYTYDRPDQRKLPSMLSNRNFTVMVSLLGPDILLNLFSYLLFERRILFVSSKLFHLTACVFGCLHLIYPMHWQSILVPILPKTILWTAQCTTPFIIGIHSSLFSTLDMKDLGDVIIVNIDEQKLESPYNDLEIFPKHISRSLRKGIQQSSKMAGDHLAKVFLRVMVFAIGNYKRGFDSPNGKLDFDRDRYLQSYLGTSTHTFLSFVAQTQMFEQFSRYKTFAHLQPEVDVDEFDLEVKNLEKIKQSKNYKDNKKIYKLFERAATPIIEQVQNKTEKLQTAINKAGQRVANEASAVKNNLIAFDINEVIRRTHHARMKNAIENDRTDNSAMKHQLSSPDLLDEGSIPYERMNSREHQFSSQPELINNDALSSSSSSSSSRSSTPDMEQMKSNPLIDLDTVENSLLPTSITLNVISTPITPPTQRQTVQIDSKIKQLQDELQHKVQTFDGKRIDPRSEYGQQKEIRKLVEHFDPFDDINRPNRSSQENAISQPVTFRTDEKSTTNPFDRHPSIYESIPVNHVHNVLQNIQTTFGTPNRTSFRTSQSVPQRLQSSANNFSPIPTVFTSPRPTEISRASNDNLLDSFDPLAATTEQVVRPTSTTKGSNLIDFD